MNTHKTLDDIERDNDNRPPTVFDMLFEFAVMVALFVAVGNVAWWWLGAQIAALFGR